MSWFFTPMDVWIAWRHLRMGHKPPVWVWPLILGSIYIVIVGAAFAWHAESLGDMGSTGTVLGPFGPEEVELGPTALERYYGAFGRLTLYVGVMALVFGLLSLFFNLLPTIITMSVLLGCMALVVVLSLMSGLEGDLREKILNQRAHIQISKADGTPFEDYEALARALAEGDGLAGASPYLQGEIMVRSGLNRQGAVLIGIVPLQQTTVSNLADLVREGEYEHLLHPEDIPDPDPFAMVDEGTPWRLRHLDETRKKSREKAAKVREEDRKAASKLPPGTDEPPTERPSLGVAGDTKAPDREPDPEVDLPSDDDEAGWEDPVEQLRKRDGGLPGIDDVPEPIEPIAPVEPAKAPDAPSDGWEDPNEYLPKRDDPKGLPKPPVPRPPLELGDAIDDARVLDPILIGRELSMELGARVGDEVQLITPIGRVTPAGQFPGVLGARIGGIFFSGMYEYDRKNVYAPLDVVQRFLMTGDRVSGIEVKLEDVDAIDAGKAEVEAIVARMGRDDLLVEDWRDLNRNLFSAMFLEKVAMFIALLFVVLVASFGILASNLMSVMEKSKEIALFKAMGDTDQAIMRRFIAEGLCVGLLGGFGGIAMGLALCFDLDQYGFPLNENVYYIEKLPVVVNPLEVTLVGVAALVIVCLSSLYPALVAARLRPVDALRQADQ